MAEVQQTTLNAVQLVGVRRRVPRADKAKGLVDAQRAFWDAMEQAGIQSAGSEMVVYYDLDDEVEITVGVMMDVIPHGMSGYWMAKSKALLARHRGGHSDLPAVHVELRAQADAKNLAGRGYIRELYRVVADVPQLNVVDVFYDISA